MEPLDLTNKVFGRLTVLSFAGSQRSAAGRMLRKWHCQCSCGSTVDVSVSSLRIGETRSCGCIVLEGTHTTHGLAPKTKKDRHPLYAAWCSMRSRCRNPNHDDYYLYGARGIRVCKRWDSFASFLMDMGNKPSPKHTIDRIDTNGNYEPHNCRWATPSEQALNRRPKSKKSFSGEVTRR